MKLVCSAVLILWVEVESVLSSQAVDPLLTQRQLEEMAFAKPRITLQAAAKLAESAIRKKKDLKAYFLKEAALSSTSGLVEPVWCFRWVRYGDRKNEDLSLDVVVTMKGQTFYPMECPRSANP